jgi:hypothetical protein
MANTTAATSHTQRQDSGSSTAQTVIRTARPVGASGRGLYRDPVHQQVETPAAAPAGRLRAAGLGGAVGFAVAIAATALAFSIIAMPLYLLARSDSDGGVDEGLIRGGLFAVAVPLGLVAGIVAGVLVSIWYVRGGRLPRDRTLSEER